MSQKARERSIAEFKACKTGVLFSSDVTARGIDVQDVTMVLQIGVPMNPEVCPSFFPLVLLLPCPRRSPDECGLFF